MNIKEYRSKNRHLPEFLLDFHDQKDFFKILWEWQNESDNKSMENHTWVSQHIFVIDVLLPFLAAHGYRLEKIRRPKMAFYDLQNEIKNYKDKESDLFKAMLEKR